MFFIKEYKNREVAKKYFKKYSFFKWKTSFQIQEAIQCRWNQIYYKHIDNVITLNTLFLEWKPIDFIQIWSMLEEIHSIWKMHTYIHWDYYLKNILVHKKTYQVIDFEGPKEYEESKYYYQNDIYVDIWIFIMKLISTQYIFKLFFTNFAPYIKDFLNGYCKKINSEKILDAILHEMKRDLRWKKKAGYFVWIFWSIYYFYMIKKIKTWIA